MTATDPDTGDSLVYQLSGTDQASFVIDAATGQLKTKAALDYETKQVYSVVVSVSDNKNPAGDADDAVDDTVTVTINVGNVDEAGTVTLTPPTVQVGAQIEAALSDLDGTPTGIVWQWARSTDPTTNPWVDIGSATSNAYTPTSADSGQRLRATANYSDPQGANKSASAATASGTNTAPEFATDTATREIAENTAADTNIGDAVTATDPDTGDSLVYQLSGTDQTSFVIDAATGQLKTKAALDYETKQVYSVVVSVSDNKNPAGDADEAVDDTVTVTINVGNADESGTVPTGLWFLDDGSGLVAVDSVGSNNGALGGGASFTGDGLIGGAVGLDGSDDHVDIGAAVVDTTESYTVSAYVRLDSSSGTQTVLSQDGNRTSGFFLQSEAGRWTFAVPSGDSNSFVAGRALSSSGVLAGVWAHLVGVHDGEADELRLYVNGEQAGTAAFATPWSATGSLVFGRGKYWGRPVDFLDGRIDEVRTYDRALTSNEIAELYDENPAEVEAANDPPVFAADAVTRTVAENTTAGDVGAAVTATDADSDVLTYSVAAASTSQADTAHLTAFNTDFAINATTGQVTVKAGGRRHRNGDDQRRQRRRVRDGSDRSLVP